MKTNEVVTSYHIKHHKSGIVELLINTRDRWISYCRYSDDEYGIDLDIDEMPNYMLQIPELKDLKGNYMRAHSQEKDQIVYYFIPYELLGVDTSKLKRHDNN